MKALIAYLFRLILRSRYKVNIKSDFTLKQTHSTLIIPNHPAEIDPVIISAFLWNYYQPKPVVLETIFLMPVVNNILRLCDAIAMPDMEQGSGFYKRKRIEKALSQISDKIHSGDNILIYPSGRLSIDGREILGGASGIYKIISELKNSHNQEIKVMLVRTSGLWGSRFSKSHTAGKRPDILQSSLSALKTILKNFILFVPKRTVQIDLEEVPLSKLSNFSATDLNAFLESWYNQANVAKLNLVKDAFWQDLPTQQIDKKPPDFKEIDIDLSDKQKLLDFLAKLSSKNSSDINASSSLSDDLALDSLSISELMIWLQENYDLHDLELSELRYVNDIFKAISGHPKSSGPALIKAPPAWLRKDDLAPAAVRPGAKNLASAIIYSCKDNFNLPVFSDPVLGIKKYADLLRAALLFKSEIEKLSGDKIAILLPASGLATIITLASWMAHKTPVFLNWTAGLKNLRYSLDSLNIRQIISAGAFLDKINTDLSELNDSFVLVEEFKQNFTLSLKTKAYLSSFLPAKNLIHNLNLENISEDAAAVILFTSGSESTPKTVPLSHKNILTNIKDIFNCFHIKKSDVLFGFLPPFHSFGLTVTSILPLVGGLRVAFYPNPNESSKIAINCYTWGITIMAGTPSFLRGIFLSAEKECFGSLRVIMSGAEKLPDDLKKLVANKAAHAHLLEGYGITECAPVVCAQRICEGELNSNEEGVGSNLPSVKIKIVDPQTHAELEQGQDGLILISGESVFAGYLEEDRNPFIIIDQQQWYNSGDLGRISNGALVLAGRLKRFIKIGGEMISLPALEESLAKAFNKQESESQFSFAIIDKQDPDNQKVTLMLFTNHPGLDLEKVNQTLKEAGHSALAKIREIIRLDELPTLGSGKIDYVDSGIMVLEGFCRATFALQK